MKVRPAKTQISLGIRPVWPESLLCTQWVAKDPSFLHVDSEDSDQTGRMPRLIWVFAGRTYRFVGFVMRRFILSSKFSNPWEKGSQHHVACDPSKGMHSHQVRRYPSLLVKLKIVSNTVLAPIGRLTWTFIVHLCGKCPFHMFFFFFIWGLWRVKIISLILSQVNRNVGWKGEILEKNSLTTHKQNLACLTCDLS